MDLKSVLPDINGSILFYVFKTWFLPEPWVALRVSERPKFPRILSGAVNWAWYTLVGPIKSLHAFIASHRANILTSDGPLEENWLSINISYLTLSWLVLCRTLLSEHDGWILFCSAFCHHLFAASSGVVSLAVKWPVRLERSHVI